MVRSQIVLNEEEVNRIQLFVRNEYSEKQIAKIINDCELPFNFDEQVCVKNVVNTYLYQYSPTYRKLVRSRALFFCRMKFNSLLSKRARAKNAAKKSAEENIELNKIAELSAENAEFLAKKIEIAQRTAQNNRDQLLSSVESALDRLGIIEYAIKNPTVQNEPIHVKLAREIIARRVIKNAAAFIAERKNARSRLAAIVNEKTTDETETAKPAKKSAKTAKKTEFDDLVLDLSSLETKKPAEKSAETPQIAKKSAKTAKKSTKIAKNAETAEKIAEIVETPKTAKKSAKKSTKSVKIAEIAESAEKIVEKPVEIAAPAKTVKIAKNAISDEKIVQIKNELRAKNSAEYMKKYFAQRESAENAAAEKKQ